MDVTTPVIEVSEIVSGITSNLGVFSVDNLLVFIGAGVGTAAGLVLTWFGYSWIKRRAMAALKKGKL